MRVPRPGSPGHWWDRPHPGLAISRLCLWALAFSPLASLSGGSPFCDRRSLTWASSCPTRPLAAGGGAGLVFVPGLAAGAEAGGVDADGVGSPEGDPAVDGSVAGADAPAGWGPPGGLAVAGAAPPPMRAAAGGRKRKGGNRRLRPTL